jgi:hypothetical protein
MKRLLDDTTESMYWIGFLLADGWFDFRKNYIGLTLSIKDKSHVMKLCEFLDSVAYEEETHGEYGTFKMWRTTKRDKDTFNLLTTKYGILPKKTYNPPTKLISNLDVISDDLFLSFMIGFFDGDGSMVSIPKHNSLSMRFQNHSGWKFLLEYFEERVYDIFKYKKSVKLTKLITTQQGNDTVCLSLARYALVNSISEKVNELNLPVLSRKWDKVDQFLKIRQQKMGAGQMVSKRNKRWLDAEIHILKQNSGLSVVELQQKYFPNRTYNSISGKVNSLK